ncbi:MFS transporter [Clostridium boliviensis]|uniref:MFS transporter n=1 Tax=Clostridium boliviensis TaxID=318465 RepID=A0ABU4GHY0_9CLOT|nr:MFS transporter [Clostridium boliviensis]MDW2797213.1 MFS transporter [Clostridium boliviensis]
MKLSPKSLYSNNKFNYGWMIVFVAALSYFFSAPGQTFFISGFIDIYVKELKWDRTIVSSLYSIATLFSGLFIFSVGQIADRIGTKITMIAVGILLGLVCIWNSFNFSLFSLFIGFAFSRFLGQGSMTLLPSLVLPKWFIKKRAMSFSIMSIGGVIASTLIPIINASLFKIISWREVWRIWGFLVWIIFVPITYFYLFNRPEEIGLLPDNEKRADEHLRSIKFSDKEEYFTPKEAMKTFAFWGMLYCQIILPLITTGLTFHLISIMESKNMTSGNAAMILSFFSMVSFPVTLISGKFMDGVKQHHVAAVISMIELAALLVLFFTDSLPMAIVFAVLHGTATGLQSINNGVVWSNYFGTLYLGSIRGISMVGNVISSAVGPLPFGILFMKFGNYNAVLLLMMVLPVIGFLIALFSKKPNAPKRYSVV